MQQAAANEHLTLESVVTSKVAAGRLALGLLQGLVLYFLYHAAKTGGWPATQPALFAPLLLVWLLVPVILISSLGHLSARTAVVWIALAAAVIAGLAFHDFWRGSASADYGAGVTPDWRRLLPSGLLIAFSIAGFYIAHALVLAGAQDRRRIARYATYFEAAWKLAIQLAFSALFVGALWLVLSLGAELFMLVQLDFLKMLLREAWFNIPVIAFAFPVRCTSPMSGPRSCAASVHWCWCCCRGSCRSRRSLSAVFCSAWPEPVCKRCGRPVMRPRCCSARWRSWCC